MHQQRPPLPVPGSTARPRSHAGAFDRTRLRTLQSHPLDVGFPLRAVLAIFDGRDLGRRLTMHERLTLAVVSTSPTHFMTLSSKLEDREAFVQAFELFRQHLQRRSPQPNHPLIYFGSLANALGDGGWHGHFLLWRSFPAWMLWEHARRLNLVVLC